METYEEMRAYLLRPEGNCWVSNPLPEVDNMATVTRWDKEKKFECGYDGKSLGDEFITNDVDEALKWLIGK